MKYLIGKTLLGIALVSVAGGAAAAKSTTVIASTSDTTVAKAGSFAQSFTFTTAANGSITASGITGSFSALSIDVQKLVSGHYVDVSGLISSPTPVNGNLLATFSKLTADTTYKVLVTGFGLHDGVSYALTSNAYPSKYQGAGITPVPEPDTYAMLLAGIGMIGGIARRRIKRL